MRHKQHIAFNTQLFFALFVFIAFILISIYAALDGKIGVAIGFSIATLIPICFSLISPLYIIFSDEDIKIIYVLGQKEIIKWREIKGISRCGGWFLRFQGPPYYAITYYSTVKKRAFWVKGEIPKTRKVKTLIKHYYKKDII